MQFHISTEPVRPAIGAVYLQVRSRSISKKSRQRGGLDATLNFARLLPARLGGPLLMGTIKFHPGNLSGVTFYYNVAAAFRDTFRLRAPGPLFCNRAGYINPLPRLAPLKIYVADRAGGPVPVPARRSRAPHTQDLLPTYPNQYPCVICQHDVFIK
ncbi:hypothetical protein EVAR_62078_1 [Eumeta japonica]|uniref:Uncharacterized protein n=1 Tax=Eumeta variegata TaxID=151549 RepID=A0A4C1YYN0_EUMVA|nr:hypothetical protein EVAR_62078_1 [Eumeta japonica]